MTIYKERHLKHLKEDITKLQSRVEGLETIYELVDNLKKFEGKKITIRIENSINELLIEHSNKIKSLVKLSKDNYTNKYDYFYIYPLGIICDDYYSIKIHDTENFDFENFKKRVIGIYKTASVNLIEKIDQFEGIEKIFTDVNDILQLIESKQLNSIGRSILMDSLKGF